MTRFLFLILLAVSSTASAIVIRHDVDDSKHRIPASEFPALVDMPGEGHGILIAPQWVITAAHTIPEHPELKQVVINGTSRDVERVVIHSGYKKPPQELLDHALATWDWTLFVVLLSSSDDIALLKLAAPVTDVSPVAIHKGDNEFGRIVKIIGKGATGNGVTGYDFHSSHRTELRRAHNKVTSAHGRWFCYVFNKPSEALPLEGGLGGGDSGGPVLVQAEGDWLLAGLTSWTAPHQGATRTPFGQYGQISCNVRLSHYKEWIESVISAQPQAGANSSFKPKLHSACDHRGDGKSLTMREEVQVSIAVSKVVRPDNWQPSGQVTVHRTSYDWFLGAEFTLESEKIVKEALGKCVAPNNSFKPKPLRGSA